MKKERLEIEEALRRFSDRAYELAFTILSLSVATGAIASALKNVNDENLKKKAVEEISRIRKRIVGAAMRGDYDSVAKEARVLLFASGKEGYPLPKEVRPSDLKNEPIVKIMDKVRKKSIEYKIKERSPSL